MYNFKFDDSRKVFYRFPIRDSAYIINHVHTKQINSIIKWILLYTEKPSLETGCVAYKTCPLECSTRCLLYNNIY